MDDFEEPDVHQSMANRQVQCKVGAHQSGTMLDMNVRIRERSHTADRKMVVPYRKGLVAQSLLPRKHSREEHVTRPYMADMDLGDKTHYTHAIHMEAVSRKPECTNAMGDCAPRVPRSRRCRNGADHKTSR